MMLSVKCCVCVAICGPAMTQYLNLLHFRHEKEVSVPHVTKRLRVWSGHYQLAMAQGISYQEILMNTFKQKTC